MSGDNAPSLAPMGHATADALHRAGLELPEVRRLVDTALVEDLRYGPDATTQAIVDPAAHAEAAVVSRQHGVLSGVPLALVVLDAVLGAEGYRLLHAEPEGSVIAPGTTVLRLSAPVTGLLTAERSLLNLLCHASGIATATAHWVRAVAGTGCRIRDTRKTLPGLRAVQKYAVRCGGGSNHRMGLGDAVLIKDNHVVAAGSVAEALALARRRAPRLACEVEVGDLDELRAVLEAQAEVVLLDNFSPQQCAEAVRLRAVAGSSAVLEASGGLNLDAAGAYARAGVDYLAVGALTHSAPVLDLGLDM